MTWAILQEQGGLKHWMRVEGGGCTAFTTALVPPRSNFLYADHAAAERDAEILRQRNGADVEVHEAEARKRKHKFEPATYSVVAI